MTVSPITSEQGAVGFAKEATFGTFASSTLWLPVKSEGLKASPNNIFPSLIRNTRFISTVVVRGIRKVTGPVVAPVYPDAGMPFFVGAIGQEVYTTGSTPTNATALTAGSAVGATTVSTTLTFAPSSFIQIDTAASKIAEVRKVVSVTGAGPFVVTVDQPLRYAHLSAAVVTNVVAPYSHIVGTAPNLPSFTIEKYMGSTLGSDLQYSGMKATKLDIKGSTNAELEATYTFMGQQDRVNGTPGTPVMPTDIPFSPTQIALSFGGSADLSAESFDLSYDNSGKQADTFNGQSYPQVVDAFSTKLGFKCSVFVLALSGGTAAGGYYADLEGTVLNAISMTATQDAGHSLTLSLPAGSLTAADPAVKLGDWIKYDLDYTPIVDTVSGTQFTATIVNSNYLNY